MTVYLDCGPTAPAGFDPQCDRRATTAAEAIAILSGGGVTAVSLAHDLGAGADTGYDVARWLEERAYRWSQGDADGIGRIDARCHAPDPFGAARINWALSRAATWWRIGERRRAGTLPAQKKATGGKVDGYKPTGTEYKDWTLD